MRKSASKQGFTLIELLVVVSIVSLLSIVILGALNDARAKARDRALFSGVLELQKAVELYKLKYGVYPSDGIPTYISLSANGSYSPSGYEEILTRLQEFTPGLPRPTVGSVGFYTQSNVKCLGQENAPYAISFAPENLSTFSHLPFHNNSQTSLNPSLKCITSQ